MQTTADPRTNWVRAVASAFLAAVALACVGAYASQLFLGRWQTDEYRLFTDQGRWGWHALPPRLAYSPRPFSEAILFVYGRFVLAAHRPLITSFLAILWALSLGATALAARSAATASPVRSLSAAGLSLALFGFVLATNDVTEAFYWPMAAAAYMPTGFGAATLMFLLARPMTGPNRLSCALALSVVATSSEVGAALTLAFAAAAGLDLAARRQAPPTAHLWWILPGLLSLAVFAVLGSVRVNMDELGAASQPVTGHVVAALALALRRFAADLVGGADAHGAGALAAAFGTKLCFGLAFAAVCRQAGCTLPSRLHGSLAFGLVFAAFFTLFGAYYHYGTACCERQTTTRLWMIDMAVIIGMAAVLARAVPDMALLDRSGLSWLPCVLLVGSLYPVLPRLDALRHDGQVHDLALQSRARTWMSGLRSAPAMKFYMPPDAGGLLVHGTSQPLGTFQTATAPEMVQAVGQFFGKAQVTTCEPWQTEKSFLLDGHFIAACPPHGGPPDIVGHYHYDR